MKSLQIQKNKTAAAIAVTSVLLGNITNSVADTADGTGDEEIEIISVKGVRSSVISALNMKREEVGVMDAISSDDISSLPDENIAESIQRIAGVQIERDGGRGARISLRGMGPEYAATTLNGQTFAAAAVTGGFRYDIVQSELASSIQVYKTPMASIDEGGLSGTVNISTAKPLQFDGRRVLVKADATRNVDFGSTTPSFGFTLIDQSNDNKFGYSINVGYQELETLYDAMYASNWVALDLDNDSSIDYVDGKPVERPERVRLRRETNSIERNLFSGALQYRPYESLEFNLSAVAAIDKRDIHLQQFIPFFSTGSITLMNSVDGYYPNLLVENVKVEGNNTNNLEDRHSYAMTGDFTWQATEDLSVKGVVHYTEGELDKHEYNRVVSINTDLEVYLDSNSPTLISNGLNPISEPSSWSNENLLNNNIGAIPFSQQTDETAGQLDFTYDPGWNYLTSIEFGVKYRAQTLRTEKVWHIGRFTGLDSPFPDISEAYDIISDLTSGEVTGFSTYVLANIEDAFDEFGNPENVIEGDPRTGNFYEINRDIFNSYAQINFHTDQLRGNIGIRYAKTEREVNTTDTINGATSAVTTQFDYDNLLPSLNLAYDLTDEIVLRAAAGKVLVRPIISGSASFNRTLSESIDSLGRNTVTVREGSIDLPALTANQFDLSAEWYFSEASAVSVAYFSKDINNQVRTESSCPSDFDFAIVNEATNGDCVDAEGTIWNILRNRVTNGTLEITGWEFSYSQAFDFLPEPLDGFGIVTNLTKLDAKNPDEDIPLLGSSETTYNLIAYYEKGPFSARLALNHRSDFYSGAYYNAYHAGLTNPRPGTRLDARNQLDLSMSYDYSENLQFSFEALNLNKDFEKAYNFGDRLTYIGTFGPTYSLSVRYLM